MLVDWVCVWLVMFGLLLVRVLIGWLVGCLFVFVFFGVLCSWLYHVCLLLSKIVLCFSL